MAEPGPRQTFLSAITRVAFPKSNWMICIFDVSQSGGLVHPSVTLTLPSQVIQCMVFDVVNATFHPAPYTITEDSLLEKVLAEVGPNTGFAVREFPGDPIERGPFNGQVWLKLDHFLPKVPFSVVFNFTTNNPTTGTGNSSIFYVATLKGDPFVGGVLEGPNPVNIFPGAQDPDDPEEDRIVSIEAASTNTFDTVRTFTFTVNPTTLIVSPPTG